MAASGRAVVVPEGHTRAGAGHAPGPGLGVLGGLLGWLVAAGACGGEPADAPRGVAVGRGQGLPGDPDDRLIAPPLSAAAPGSEPEPGAEQDNAEPSAHATVAKMAAGVDAPITTSGPKRAPEGFVAAELGDDRVLQLLRTARPSGFRPVGSTSTVFHMRLAAPFSAAFKAATRARPMGPVAEVAAYRLARCLGLRNVPPAVSRSLPIAALEAAFTGEFATLWPQVRQALQLDDQGAVRGAAIYWIPEMVNLGLESPAGVARLTRWLVQSGRVPARARRLASHISTMLLFDYVIGNPDRFSGSNAKGTPDRTLVYLRDHDMAFPARLPAPLHRRLVRRMLRAERFSRSFVAALRHLSRACFLRELAQDPDRGGSRSRLSAARIAGVFERRIAALSHIDSLMDLYGEEAVLVFP